MQPNYYQLLGVSDSATASEIKAAFRAQALEHHPDQGGDSQQFMVIKLAYETLIDSAKRRDYDSSLEIRSFSGSYDPFEDPDYEKSQFFQPEHAKTEEFERMMRARGCRHCNGLGYITKNTNPTAGFMGLERRFCICQKTSVKA